MGFRSSWGFNEVSEVFRSFKGSQWRSRCSIVFQGVSGIQESRNVPGCLRESRRRSMKYQGVLGAFHDASSCFRRSGNCRGVANGVMRF